MAKGSFLKASFIMALGMLLGRFAGVLREIVIADRFGISSSADIAILGLTLPDLVIALTVGGAVNIVLIPQFQELGEQVKWQAYKKFQKVFAGFFLCVGFILGLFAPVLVSLLAPGLSGADFETARWVIYGILLSLPFLGMTAVSRALLQSESRFLATSVENFINNIAIIGVLYFAVGLSLVVSVIIAVLLGAILRWGSQAFAAFKAIRPAQLEAVKKVSIPKDLYRSFLNAVSAGVILVLLPIIARSLSSSNGEGYLAIFNYYYKIVEVPFNVAFAVFSIVVFPQLSRFFMSSPSEQDKVSFLSSGLKTLLLIAIPMSLCLWWVFYELMQFPQAFLKLPEEGVFTIAELSCLGFLFLVFRGVSAYSLAIFSAKKDTSSPFKANLVALVVVCASSYFLNNQYGVWGAALGLNLGYLAAFAIEQYLLWSRHKVFLWRGSASLSGLFLTVASLGFLWGAAQLSMKVGGGFILNLALAATVGVVLLLAGFMGSKEIRSFVLKAR